MGIFRMPSTNDADGIGRCWIKNCSNKPFFLSQNPGCYHPPWSGHGLQEALGCSSASRCEY